MSNTEIYAVKTNGEVVFMDQTRNSWRGAMHVWTKLSEKYNTKSGMFADFSDLWKMADKGIFTDTENIVMKSTFDNVIVKKEEIPMLLEAFRDYEEKFPNSSFVEQAQIIEEQILNDDDYIAVCWNQTSVNENPWIAGYDEDEEESIPYNMLTGEKHWFLAKVND